MADPQGLCGYGGFTNIIGGDYTCSRGVQPGVFRLRTTAETTFNKYVGRLTLSFGSEVLQFENCATAPHIQRIAKGRGRYQWTIQVYDKRWKWRYSRISGHYNVRRCDGTIDPDTKKTLLELLKLLLNALAEPNQDIRDVPNVNPEVKWDKAYAGRELEWLCDLGGLVVCLQPSGDILIIRLGNGQGLTDRLDNISPVYTYTQSTMPSFVQVRTGPTVFQSVINLQAVGLDTDGTIKPVDALTYKPTLGWSTEWYTTFAGVARANRYLAFQSVWRWYRLQSQAGSTGDVSLDTMKNLRIMERLAETHNDDLGVGRCLDAVVKGIYWPLSDLKVNTEATEKYSGSFRVIPHLNMIAFDYPVIQWTNAAVAPATLQLYVAYNAVAPTGEYIDEVFARPVPEAIVPTAPRVEKRQYMKRVRNFASPYSAATPDNIADITTEANEYLTGVVGTYAGGSEKDMFYDGFVPTGPSGKIAQVMYRWGIGRIATTRVSENHEFDVSQPSHQARRRMERLGQLFDRVYES